MRQAKNPRQQETRIDVSFGVSGDELVPSALSSRLGLQPDWAFAKGEEFQSPTGVHQRHHGVWAIASKSHISSDDLADHIRYILETLDPVRDVVNEIKQDPSSRVSVGIWWEPEGEQGGYTLKAATVATLCQYCDEIDFYFA